MLENYTAIKTNALFNHLMHTVKTKSVSFKMLRHILSLLFFSLVFSLSLRFILPPLQDFLGTYRPNASGQCLLGRRIIQ